MRSPAWQRALLTGACGYECVALWSSLPPITTIVRRHPWMAPVIVGWLAVHFQPESPV